MRPLLFVAFFLLSAFCLLLTAAFPDETHPIVILEVAGTIDPALGRYVTRGLEEARALQAAAVVIQLDTPGGLDGSMRKIVQAILNSPVPVIVYVAPAGARAASAGAFITLAAHLSAMAPGTNIGAAHPVQIGPGGAEGGKGDTMTEKITNDAAAYIRSIVEIRGRDAAWAQGLVRQSLSHSAEDAKKAGGVDFIAKNLEDLFTQAEGKEVRTVFGLARLSFKDAPQKRIGPSVVEKGLHELAHPNLAYILLLLGIYGLIYELATPGTVFPGVVGAILLVLALAALETLQVNWAGLFLILLSILFFIADIKLPGFGALTVGGVIAFALGSVMLFPQGRWPGFRIPWGTIFTATGTTAAFFLFIVGAALRALKRKVVSGAEGLIGAVGTARTDLRPEGLVHVQGEDWKARAAAPIPKGGRIKVVKLEGLTVYVEPLKEE
ncbi:MAG: nodulation protein NfeD [Candidatus Omnitrophica bacterium]|nr:nodulation protein NfeD [Candidatus Omnitrophota bacterium]